VVECDLAKVEVAGSNPVSRSMFFVPVPPHGTRAYTARARYPSGKGEVCKTFMRRFDSDPRLQSSVARSGKQNLALFT
jgi:hypothetical protein